MTDIICRHCGKKLGTMQVLGFGLPQLDVSYETCEACIGRESGVQ